jgi:perosamine synthetase
MADSSAPAAPIALGDGWLNFLPPLPPSVLPARSRPLPFPFDDRRCRVTNFSRNALWYGLQALDLEAGDELLMPAYHCGSEVAGVVELGVVPRFWGGDERLEPDATELERLLGPRTRGLYLIHHLGLAYDAPRWRRWCNERELLLLEDAAPGWPAFLHGRPLGSWGDLALFSPWKTFGLPNCGVVLSDPPAATPAPDGRLPVGALLKGFLRWPLQRSAFAAGLKARLQDIPVERAAGGEFRLHEPERGVSKASLALLRRLVRSETRTTRARNYDWLAERFGEAVPPPFRRRAEEGCPFGVPVAVTDKPGFLRHLAQRGIAGLDFWSVAHSALPGGAFPESDRMRETIVVLPVHQHLRQRDLDRIASAVVTWPGAGVR